MAETGLVDAALEARLREVGTRLAYPATPDLWPAVRRRIGAPRRRTAWLATFRSQRFGYAPAFAATALLLIAAVLLASPDARAAAEELLGLRGIQIFRTPATASPSATRPATPTATPTPSLGARVSLEEARQQAPFRVLVPTDAALDAPDEVYVEGSGQSFRVTFVYRTRPGIPVSEQAGVSALFVEFAGRVEAPLFGKALDPGTKLDQVTVNGGPGFWLEGKPHQFFYQDQAGIRLETLRLAGNTLIWEQAPLTLRLEAQVDEATALRIATSVR